MDPASTSPALRPLLGVWEGTGSGAFPTIDPFTYREVLEVTEAGMTVIHYRQRTWRHEDGTEVGSHMETGYISVGDNDVVQVLNAQGDDRVEVLTGIASVSQGVVRYDLHSVVLAHDDRMIESWREIEVGRDELRYTMDMATTSVPDRTIHLTATLTRQ